MFVISAFICRYENLEWLDELSVTVREFGGIGLANAFEPYIGQLDRQSFAKGKKNSIVTSYRSKFISGIISSHTVDFYSEIDIKFNSIVISGDVELNPGPNSNRLALFTVF